MAKTWENADSPGQHGGLQWRSSSVELLDAPLYVGTTSLNAPFDGLHRQTIIRLNLRSNLRVLY